MRRFSPLCTSGHASLHNAALGFYCTWRNARRASSVIASFSSCLLSDLRCGCQLSSSVVSHDRYPDQTINHDYPAMTSTTSVSPPSEWISLLHMGAPYFQRVRYILTSSSAVAVAYENGSQIAVARINADQRYKNLMVEMSHGEPRGAPMFPGSPEEVPVFTEMIGKLRIAAESFLGYKIHAALVATPLLFGERTSYLDQAIENNGLINMDQMVKDQPKAFRHPCAIEAARGIGLCKNYHNVSACDDEEIAMPQEFVLSILFTSNALCVEAAWMHSAYGYYVYTADRDNTDFSLGYEMRDRNPSEKYYWEAVKDRIISGASGVYPYHKLARIHLFGDSDAVDDPRTRDAVDDAMRRLHVDTIPVYAEDPVFAVVKGAAEIARRGTWPYMKQVHVEESVKLVIQV